VQKLSAEQIDQILAMTEPGQLDLVLRFNFLKAFIVHKDMNDVEVEAFYIDKTNPEMRIYTVFRDMKDSSAHKKEIGSKISAVSKVPANKAARASFAEALEGKLNAFGSSDSLGEAMEKGMGKGGKGKSSFAKGKGKGKTKTKADIKHMGEVNKVCYQILNECNTMLFSSETLSQARDYLDSHAQLLKEYATDVNHADGVFVTHERRKAAEKRKMEKEQEKELKKQKTEATITTQPEAEDWPEEEEEAQADEDGEEWAEDEENDEGNEGWNVEPPQKRARA
ncbi:unnamed protein product, partial [Symbiodinium necroappetens]